MSCNIVIPKATRPNEGLLFINTELSPMASPQFEAGRQTDTSVLVNRFLDKCFKESKCIDLESLCIVAEEKVWEIVTYCDDLLQSDSGGVCVDPILRTLHLTLTVPEI